MRLTAAQVRMIIGAVSDPAPATDDFSAEFDTVIATGGRAAPAPG